MRRLAVLLLLLLPLAAPADEAGDAVLTVKPMLCIVDQRTPSCDMRFLLVWESRDRGYYCVSSELDSEALRCWDDARSGLHEDQRNVVETFRYLLDRGEDNTELASATVEVLKKDGDDRRRHRRTRYVWDLL